MKTALIGHTGFVGSNLKASGSFDAFFNSQNVEEISNQSFARIVCAGVSAVKWQANREPDDDWAKIGRLIRCLETARTEIFVLISTIDVYPSPSGVDENTAIGHDEGQAYGRHRLRLEDFVREHFAVACIIRLPALFGHGLKKNVIFDLVTNNQLDVINPASSFQWYDVSKLAADLDTVVAAELELVNLTTEPLSVATIQASFFPHREIGARAAPAARYDTRSIYAERFGGYGGYFWSRDQIMQRLGLFLASQRTVST